MCKIPKIVIVAPSEKHQELRRALSSLEYDIAAAVATADEAAAITGDVALAWQPDKDTLLRLRELSFRTVAVGGEAASADMTLRAEELASFKTRIWELFRPA